MRIWSLHLGRWVSMSELVPDGWKSFRLGDVAEEISDRVDNPSKSGYDRFVGLDHLDSGELTVRRWGSTADLLSAMKLFKSGDILIGRRNAYLKRASKAEFDGVCSGDAYVVREKPGTIAGGLLPIILNSDSFWDYTIAHASGTMSKRAKWRDLVEYTFLLPSPEEQHRIATTLWAAEDCIVKGERFVAAAERAKQVLMGELFSKGIGHTEFQQVKGFGIVPKGWNVHLLSEVSSVKTGPFGAQLHQKDYVDIGSPIITVEHLGDISVLHENLPLVSDHDKKRLSQYILNEGDIVFSRVGSIDRNCLITSKEAGWLFSGRLLRVRFDKEKVISTYLNSYFNFEPFKQRVRNVAVGGTMPCLNTKLLSDIRIPLPPLPEQRHIAGILTRCDEMIAAARANVAAAKALKMKMINEMMSAE